MTNIILISHGHSILTALECIVYDNACGLHAYCLNRDPNFFKNTRFLVDRFHYSNHTGKTVYACSLSSKLYNQPT